jgi:sodium/hydrogen exchanger 8
MLCFVARALNIIPLTLIANLWRRDKISIRETIMLWFTGLRGAIAFALALHTIGVTPNSNQIVTTTLVIVIFTVWVIGGLSYPMLKLLKLDSQYQLSGSTQKSTALLLVNKGIHEVTEPVPVERIVHDDQISEQQHQEQVVLGHRKVDTWVKRLNRNVLVPFFRRKGTGSQTLRELLFSGGIADHMVRTLQLTLTT